jgi:hypothetical protein
MGGDEVFHPDRGIDAKDLKFQMIDQMIKEARKNHMHQIPCLLVKEDEKKERVKVAEKFYPQIRVMVCGIYNKNDACTNCRIENNVD